MTDRVHSFVVVLDKDMRVDDVKAVITALRMVKHVIKVTPNVADVTSMMAYARARQELEAKLWAALQEEKTP